MEIDRELIRRYFLDFQGRSLPNGIQREIAFTSTNKIWAIIGSRRVGKTFLMYQRMSELIQSGYRKTQILYINLENPVFLQVNVSNFKTILEIYFSLFPEEIDQELIIFIDEPQVKENWEMAIRGLYDEFRYAIYLTGSSSKVLGKEIATNLRGRSLSLQLFPFSFTEFLQFKKFSPDSERLATNDHAKLKAFFDEYLHFGGYPEVVFTLDEESKIRILQSYLELIIYRDIFERYNIRNTTALKWMIQYLIKTIGNPISLKKMRGNFQSQGLNISPNTLHDYFGILHDACFLFSLHRIGEHITKPDLTLPKIFLNDIGFLSLYFIEDFGARLENIVYLNLARLQIRKPRMQFFYWRGSYDVECDFVIYQADRPQKAIQVSMSLGDPLTYEREIRGLLACLKDYNFSEGWILTYDEERLVEVEGKKIHVLPVWKWSLQGSIETI